MATLDLTPNTEFAGEFRILQALRVGGMGAVYIAEQRSTGTKRALKLMQRELVADKTLRERFEQEARVGASIDSDHVVQVVGAGVDAQSGIPWLAMELLDGSPLDVYLTNKGPRPPGEVRFLFEQLCHALGAAHDKGIVHRDLKPANVFLATSRVVGLSWMVKVLDFGIAKVLAEAKTAKTAAIGTPMYMAPEQYEAGRVSPATDVWALGLIAFELLTGKSYWKCARDGQATPASIMYETCLADATKASDRAAELGIDARLPERFDAWFERCLQKSPDARHADARAAFEALAEVLGPATPPVDKLPTTKRVAAAPTVAMESGTAAMTPAAVATSVRTAIADGLPSEVAAVAATPKTEAMTSARPADKARRGWIAVAAATVLAVAVYAGTRPPRVEDPEPKPPVAHASGSTASAAIPAGPTATFARGDAIAVEGRLLHKNVPPGVRTRSFMMVDLRGGALGAAKAPPVDVSLVIDRSGSMKGGRLDHAITAAITAIERLRDGDRVSVIAFDQTAQTIVPQTLVDAGSRIAMTAAVRKITLGGDTCMSCGITRAVDDLGPSSGRARRILLLSDGEATAGIKDVAGLEKLAHDAEARDVSITTIGVGQDYDPRALTAIARASNGRHHYAGTESAMPAIFDEEARAMGSVVAADAKATIKFQPGVELIAVRERKHTITGSTVSVPLGQFTSGERKTILIEIAVTPAAMGPLTVATVDVGFRDQASGTNKHEEGTLALLVASGVSETDPVVDARVQRSETASALLEANQLFAQGKTAEAQVVLSKQATVLAAKKTQLAAQPKPAPTVAGDIDAQKKDVESAGAAYGAAAQQAPAAPAAAPAAKAELRKSAKKAYDMGY